MLRTAWQLFTAGDLPDKPVRLIGVGISDWAQGEPAQADLFDQAAPGPDSRRLLETIDRVREKFGKGKLQRGLSRKQRRP
jgi:DNA polymerase-4